VAKHAAYIQVGERGREAIEGVAEIHHQGEKNEGGRKVVHRLIEVSCWSRKGAESTYKNRGKHMYHNLGEGGR
jgi:hypothetical protein